ncbi:hypothetical protein [Bradyrhizobium sp. SZCCHNS30581]|uniref:hypothetical protein n=1 Tax=Bradyrhizobium sp. SZCCHNS30581 TaxID=3057326 RepID=UPI00291684FB|nr:hypothetical protein [Bradyrhizobium sp. SZCCHNS30581]
MHRVLDLGATGVFVSLAIGGFTASDIVVANVLFFLALAVSLILIGRSANWSTRRSRILATATVVVLLGLLDAIVLFRHSDATTSLQQKPTEVVSGGNVQVFPSGVELNPNGKFKFPLTIRNNGEEPIINYGYWFRQAVTDRILTIAEENAEFEKATKNFLSDARANKPNRKLFIGNLLKLTDTAQIAQSNEGLDKATVDNISQGRQFVYNFLVVHYTDKQSIKDNKYYIAEYCGRGVGPIVPCAFHNIMKRPED